MDAKTGLIGDLRRALTALRGFTPLRVAAAACAAVASALVVGLATVLIPNPVFGRDIAPVWWNYPVWALTSALVGILAATYVSRPDTAAAGTAAAGGAAPCADDGDAGRGGPLGLLGGVLAWFAVGCPVCNKLAVLALGYSGAITWFAPFQPLLAAVALVLVGAAVVRRLAGEVACPVRTAHLPDQRRLASTQAGGRQ